MKPNEQLRTMVDDYGLSRQEVADMCGVSIAAVNGWLRSPHSKAFRMPPKSAIKLLELLLRDREKAPRKPRWTRADVSGRGGEAGEGLEGGQTGPTGNRPDEAVNGS